MWYAYNNAVVACVGLDLALVLYKHACGGDGAASTEGHLTVTVIVYITCITYVAFVTDIQRYYKTVLTIDEAQKCGFSEPQGKGRARDGTWRCRHSDSCTKGRNSSDSTGTCTSVAPLCAHRVKSPEKVRKWALEETLKSLLAKRICKAWRAKDALCAAFNE